MQKPGSTKLAEMVKQSKRFVPMALSTLMMFSVISASGVLAAKNAAPVKKETTPVKTAPKASEPKATEKGDKPVVKATAAQIDASIASAAKVDPLDLLRSPTQYINKKVTFTGTFNRFADIALDYKKAFRDSRDYVTFFILRPDVGEHTIPLAEMKLFFPRKQSDEVTELEAGDKIQVVGTQFSSALEEPWIDVEHIKILEKTAKSERKHVPEF